MPLDGHSYLVSQGWSGHGTGLRQDSIIRPLAIPQKRTLAGLGKDRDDAFPFWDHVFSIAAKTIQVKLYKDDDDDSDTDSTPRQASLDLTTTGILSNKPPKLGSSALATPASSSPDSGLNTPTTATIPNALVSSSSNLLIAAKKESAKRMLYSRFFRGPILGPDSDSSASSHDDRSGSHSNGNPKTRIGDDDSGWNSNFNGAGKSGGRTPMAIAKSKLTGASEAVIPSKKVLEKAKGEEHKKKKRKRSDDDEVEVKRQEKAEKEGRKKKDGEGKKREREEKKEKKTTKHDEKEGLKEEEKREKKSKKDKTRKVPVADESSSLERTRSEEGPSQTVEPNEVSTVLDKSNSIPCSRKEELDNVGSRTSEKKRRKVKDDKRDIFGDKGERRCERKQKRERKEAKQLASAAPQVISADGEEPNGFKTKSASSLVKHSEELCSELKKKKRRKTDE